MAEVFKSSFVLIIVVPCLATFFGLLIRLTSRRDRRTNWLPKSDLHVSFDLAIAALVVITTFAGFVARYNVSTATGAILLKYQATPLVLLVMAITLLFTALIVRMKGWKKSRRGQEPTWGVGIILPFGVAICFLGVAYFWIEY